MLLFFIALIVVNASGAANFRRYHRTVGIPAAERRLEIERRIIESGHDAVNTRIVGGHKADHVHFPWLAGLLVTLENTSGRSLCSGSLLTPSGVVTAAHCWVDDDSIGTYIEVVLGSDFVFYGGTRIWSCDVVVHPDSTVSNETTQYPVDVAMILLPPGAVNFSSTIKPISLPAAFKSHTFAGYSSFAAGYGLIRNIPKAVAADQNRYVELEVLPNKECKQCTTFKNILCTSGEGKVGVCYGDSGGPLSVKICGEDFLIGIIHGFSSLQSMDCEFGDPSFYIRVTEIVDWIVANQY